MPKNSQKSDESSEVYDEIVKTIARRLKEARQKLGLTQSQMAAKIEAGQSFIFEIENAGSNVTVRTLARLSLALGMSARDFLPDSVGSPLSAVSYAELRTALTQLKIVVADRHAQEGALLAQISSLIGLDDQPASSIHLEGPEKA